MIYLKKKGKKYGNFFISYTLKFHEHALHVYNQFPLKINKAPRIYTDPRGFTKWCSKSKCLSVLTLLHAIFLSMRPFIRNLY